MRDPIFSRVAKPLSLDEVARSGSARLPPGAEAAKQIEAVATLSAARSGDIAVFGEGAAADDLRTTRAGACFVTAQDSALVPAATVALVTDDPMGAFSAAAALIESGAPHPWTCSQGEAARRRAFVDERAFVEPGASIGPGAVIGPGAEIGMGSVIGANCVIEADVRVGRGCAIGPLTTLRHALLGDDVVVESGAQIGVGEGTAVCPGRAIVQNGALIGANAVVARGAVGDTVIGEGAIVEASAFVASDTVVARRASVRRAPR